MNFLHILVLPTLLMVTVVHFPPHVLSPLKHFEFRKFEFLRPEILPSQYQSLSSWQIAGLKLYRNGISNLMNSSTIHHMKDSSSH